MRRHRLGEQERTLDVDPVAVVPVLFLLIREGQAEPAAEEPRIVDQDVDLGERLQAGFHQIETILSDGDVRPDRQGSPPLFPHLGGTAFRPFQIDVRHHHVRPFPSQSQTDAGADATPAAGHHGDPILQAHD